MNPDLFPLSPFVCFSIICLSHCCFLQKKYLLQKLIYLLSSPGTQTLIMNSSSLHMPFPHSQCLPWLSKFSFGSVSSMNYFPPGSPDLFFPSLNALTFYGRECTYILCTYILYHTKLYLNFTNWLEWLKKLMECRHYIFVLFSFLSQLLANFWGYWGCLKNLLYIWLSYIPYFPVALICYSIIAPSPKVPDHIIYFSLIIHRH